MELEIGADFSLTFGASGMAATLRRKGFEDENCEVIVIPSMCQWHRQKSFVVEEPSSGFDIERRGGGCVRSRWSLQSIVP